MVTDADAADTPEYGIHPPDYRLPASTRLGPVRLQVASMARSLSYYQRVLGLTELDRSGSRVVLGIEDRLSPLVELVEVTGSNPVPARGRLGLYHYAILLPDRAALGRFAAHLAAIGEPAGASDHLVSEALYLRDPDGLGIEVYADRPRADWRQRDGQLVMATEPLDVAGLVTASGDERWSGMPVGTAIGHLHLHVGDLDLAEGFYHTALGLDKVVWSYPGALFLSAGGYHHHLGVNTWAADAPPAGENDARLLEWEILVPDSEEAERALRSLEAAGHPVRRSDDGGTVADPWGTVVRIRSAGEGV